MTTEQLSNLVLQKFQVLNLKEERKQIFKNSSEGLRVFTNGINVFLISKAMQNNFLKSDRSLISSSYLVSLGYYCCYYYN